MNLDDSTKFSPWFSLGCLSPRRVYAELKRYEQERGANESTYWVFFELLWRDYFKFLSRRYKEKIFLQTGVASENTQTPIKNDHRFKLWCDARTQDPFVNAHMTELNQTGWMSNRGRQNVASYLIHNLKLPWTWGAAYFEQLLIDYDPDVNWGNWLYLSGNGTDPKHRAFDTQQQAAFYDPDGAYQKKWLLDL
jgi:deoxyribodipyrimidine photo-lyase